MRQTLVKVLHDNIEKHLGIIKAPTLIIWGENDTDTPIYMAEKLNKRITELGLNKQVQLVGAVKAADFLASLDIFVFPSLWEGLGLAILEAGALAKPVIASDIDGIKEVLNDDNAWLFPAGEIDKLAARMDFVMTNLESAAVKIKAEKLKNLINKHFNLDLMIEAYREWYEILLLEKSLIKNDVKK